MKKTNLTIGLLALLLLFSNLLTAQQTAQQLSKRLEQRKAAAAMRIPDAQSRSNVTEVVAPITLAFEEAIRYKASQLKIEATKPEITAVQLYVLSKNGIIDISNPPANLEQDNNVKLYLSAQNYPFEEFYLTCEALTLYYKILTKGVKISAADVENYLIEHPQAATLPERVQLSITHFIETAGSNGSRGSVWAAVSPALSLQSRGELEQTKVTVPDKWFGLQLYLRVNCLEPKLREAIAGKMPGSNFDPVEMESGAIIAGKIVQVIPEIPLADAKLGRDWLLMEVGLAKCAHAKDSFDLMVDKYFESGPTRGLWGAMKSFGKTVWKTLPYTTAAAGAIVGGIYGGWGGAIAGGKLGYESAKQVKSVVGGWFGGSSASMPTPMPQYNPYQFQRPPQYYNPQPVSPMPANYYPGYQSYLGGGYNPGYQNHMGGGGYGGYGMPPAYTPPSYYQPTYYAPPMYMPSPMGYY
ncbi:MAG: hypothetical protein JNJ57_01010 [Saprospiraceae bacterium]|nr:hypothetical protein [Saprospiraceae bacterium]